MEENQSILELHVDQTASKNLSDASRWAKFLSITGFVCMGLMLIFFLAMQSQIASALSELVPGFADLKSMGPFIAIVIIAIAIVFLLMFFLFRASTLVKRGIETKNQELFNNGLASFKAYFMMYGVIAIVGLVINFVNLF